MFVLLLDISKKSFYLYQLSSNHFIHLSFEFFHQYLSFIATISHCSFKFLYKLLYNLFSLLYSFLSSATLTNSSSLLLNFFFNSNKNSLTNLNSFSKHQPILSTYIIISIKSACLLLLFSSLFSNITYRL